MTPSGIRALCVIASFWTLAMVGCTEPALVGEECVDSADCDEGLGCFEHLGAAVTPVCMADCDMTTALTCADGSACIQALNPDGTSREAEVCYLGGSVAVGESCLNGGTATTLVCEQGSICVVTGDTATCRVPCFIDDADGCAEGETCESLASGTGFCLPGA